MVDTVAGRVLIQVVACLDDQADTRQGEIGGEPVTLEMVREPDRLSDARRRRLAEHP